MKHLFRFLTLCSILWPSFGQAQGVANPLKGQKILVFSKTKGFRHSSIPSGIAAIKLLGKKYEFAVDTTENADNFTEANLKKYKTIVFLSTTGDVLDNRQQIAFERYIQAGGSFVGVHAASDTEYDWPWYGKMVGGYFASHPGNPNVQKGTMTVTDRSMAATDSLPTTFERTDEFYDFKEFNKDVKVLITVDEKSYKDGKMGDYHPMAWYHNYDGGRVFYTNFGHTDQTFMEPLFLQHFWGGLQWAAAGKTLDYSKARSALAPEDNRFMRETLDEKLYEPTELAVIDNNRVMYINRHGEVRMYNAKAKKKVKIVGQIPVYDKFEYGLMGLNIDPKFSENQWVYLFYSPTAAVAGADTANRLVRIKYDLQKDTLLMATEQTILKVPVKRTDCCHTGGSIAWDKAGNLYLSTGDDTNPFASDGYGPIDNRAGRAGWDARASSSNTNDLRGKILRIKPLANSGYEIPEGNLFSQASKSSPSGAGGATRPEIYVMGNRNPYRISIDQHTGFLYWGEVGPDAGDNSDKYGSKGHDEVNQARRAGYFGWPLFVADNRPYNQRNFMDSTTSSRFDPLKPINDSPHNTGLQALPPAQKAFIYYPYADSPEFGPIVGKGGRNAMAGPVFYSEDHEKDSKVKFPSYFDGKFFAYDWMRDWINVVSMKPNGDFISMERLLPNMKFEHPIDMQFAQDGSLYMLEYGPNWFAQNDEARLTHITFNAGNRSPIAEATLSQSVGASPLKVSFDASKSMDYDGDALKYEWEFAKGLPKANTPKASFTYTKPGIYRPSLSITDAAGNKTTKRFEIRVGNEAPKVELSVKGNKTFYFANQAIDYEVKVNDKEDGSLENKKIAEDEVMVSVNYLEGFDKTMIAQGHQANTSFATGKRLIELSDCKACHSIDKKSIGPNYTEVAKKYNGAFMIEGKLADKIIKGGGGVWGEQAMSAHPQINKEDATEMVKYILSLADAKMASKPTKGSYTTEAKTKDGNYIFAASYTDRGANNIPPVSGNQTVVLRSNKVKANTADAQSQTMKYKLPTNAEVMVALADKGYFAFNQIDLTNIKRLSVMAFSSKEQTTGGKLELRLGAVNGQIIGEGTIDQGKIGTINLDINQPVAGLQDIYFVFTNSTPVMGKALYAIDTITFEK